LGKWIKVLLYTVAILLFIAIVCLKPLDRVPLKRHGFYKEMMSSLDRFHFDTLQQNEILAGWGKVNITPAQPFPMAGYAPRATYGSVHDSLFVRIVHLSMGQKDVFILSADLIMFPPLLKRALLDKFDSLYHGKGRPFVFFSATHTHNGIGGWDNSLLGEVVMGSYHPEWIDETTNKLVAAMFAMETTRQRSTIEYGEIDATEYVENRLAGSNGSVDGMVRSLKIIRQDGAQAVLVSYSAHATLIGSNSLEISGDYPSALVSLLEKNNDFAMFMAGMVGSHRIHGVEGKDFERIGNVAELLEYKIDSIQYMPLRGQGRNAYGIIELVHGPSQLRLSGSFALRDWVFRSIFRPLEGEISMLKLGNVMFIGTPCDFSGEIYVEHRLGKLADKQKLKLMITSFNGGYTGYITYGGHYDCCPNEEVRAMNWVGPYYGAYYVDVLQKLLEKVPN